MLITVSVDQEDIASIQTDTQVNIEFTAYTGVTYSGEIYAIVEK